MADRVVLGDKQARAEQMREHVREVAESILNDRRGDVVFDRVLRVTRHVHTYSIGNRILQSWQAPDSRLVASKTAFELMAADQGMPLADVRGKRCRVKMRKGAKAIWVWGRFAATRPVVYEETGELGEERYAYFRPVATWAAEDIQYAATSGPFEVPDFVQSVPDKGLYDRLLGFAASRGIVVTHRGLNGPRGVSMLGAIALQTGDPEVLQIGPLLHELGHELLHGPSERIELPDHIREGEAEAVASVVLRHLGYEVPVSAAYLRNHGTRPEDVIASMDRIAGAAGEIVAFIETREYAPVEETREAVAVPS